MTLNINWLERRLNQVTIRLALVFQSNTLILNHFPWEYVNGTHIFMWVFVFLTASRGSYRSTKLLVFVWIYRTLMKTTCIFT